MEFFTDILAFPPDVWGKLAFYGFLDADNWTPIVVLLLLLVQPHPLRPALFFTAGVVVPQILGGIVYMTGWQQISPHITEEVAFIANLTQIGVGLGLLAFAILSKPKKREFAKLSQVIFTHHSDFGWLTFGILVELTKLGTAAVYVLAAILIVETTDVAAERAVLLGWFNLISLAPILVIWGIYLFLDQYAQTILHAAQDWITLHQGLLLRTAIAILGAFFLYNAYMHLS